MTDNNAKTTAVPNRPQTTGFPIALIVQILLAVISYLITRAVSQYDQTYLTGLKTRLNQVMEEIGGNTR